MVVLAAVILVIGFFVALDMMGVSINWPFIRKAIRAALTKPHGGER